MQAKTKCSSVTSQSSPSSSVSCLTSTPAPSPALGDRPRRGGYRLPGSAFSESFLEKLRLVVRRLDGEKVEDCGAPTEAEAALAGPLAVERVRTRGGAAWAVVRAAESVAAGGRAAVVARDRSEAIRSDRASAPGGLAAVLPAVPAVNPYHLGDRPSSLAVMELSWQMEGARELQSQSSSKSRFRRAWRVCTSQPASTSDSRGSWIGKIEERSSLVRSAGKQKAWSIWPTCSRCCTFAPAGSVAGQSSEVGRVTRRRAPDVDPPSPHPTAERTTSTAAGV